MAASRAGGEDEGRVRVTLTQLSSRLDESRRELNRLLIDLAEGGRYNLSWDDVLSRFAVVQGKIANIARMLSSDHVKNLHNYALVPYQLTTVHSEHLQAITEGRVRIFTHESAPEYLRTKLVPDLEQKDAQIQQQAAAVSPSDVEAQIAALNAACQKALHAMEEKRRLFEAKYAPARPALTVPARLKEDYDTLLLAQYSGQGTQP